ncbi:hypothetical protein [Variovorax boronicumulans]|uniref:hypothetical protein n=1 Tax=Variovorax boronicumulans TaxID=436515 RepID=UPI0012E5C672|nr:hypothetical protein [Variovorax boronicumulans]GER09197.1 hypothetical protein VHAB30_03430 [Variovorax boronicumulans]
MATQQIQLAGFRYTKFVVVQSLEPNERETGTETAEFLRRELEARKICVPVQLERCWSAAEFLALMNRLIQEASQGEIPILQIDCHGDDMQGLEFENSSMVAWPTLGEYLLRLNIATGFNLLAVVSACFGAYFLGQMSPVERCPCYGLISTTKQVKPSELNAGFEDFYRVFLDTRDVGQAAQALAVRTLREGRWFTMPAEWWFESTVRGYLEFKCTRRVVQERARNINKELRLRGRRELSQSKLFDIHRRNQEGLVLRLFSTFFSIGDVPSNVDRFSDCYARAEAWVARIRARGTHIL